MLKFASFLTILALLIGLVAAIPVSATPAAQTDLSKVDLDALEREIFAEVNKVRTNPGQVATFLTNAKKTAKPGPYGLEFTLPDSSPTQAYQSYLDSAISTAARLQPMSALVWSDGLAQTAGRYANKNPKGHFAFGTTPSTRMAEFGSPLGGSAESIDYGGYTGVLATYRLYLDSGVASLGHRTMMINPQLTHLGVGCFYKNMYDNITCVLNYAEGWVDKANMVKLEVGKQYAYREKDNTFRYFKLTILSGDAFRIEVCPDPPNGGSIGGTGTGGLTTPEAAAMEGRVAKNKPCDESKAPFGVLNNGTRYPTNSTAPSNPPAATATPAPASQPTVKEIRETVNVEEEQLYAQRLEGNSFQYVKYLWHDASGYRFGLCPNATVLAPITLQTTNGMLTPKTALDNGLTASNEPCPLNPPSYEIGKQYGLAHGPGHVSYIKLLSYNKEASSDTRLYTYSACGSDKEFDLTTKGAYVAVKTIDEVTREGRVTVNKPCASIQNGK